MATLGESSVPVYNLLNSLVPTGGFYTEERTRIPYRTKPCDVLLKTVHANRVYGVFINDVFWGESQSNWEGMVLFNLLLPPKIVEVKIYDSVTAEYQLIDLANPKFMTWLGAFSDTLDSLDLEIQRVAASQAIETVSSDDIESNFGQFVATSRVSSYTLDVYRELLIEIIQAFKYWSATPEGLANVIAAFTQVRPSIRSLRKSWKRWLLGWQQLKNREMNERYRYATSNLASTGIVATAVSGANNVGMGQLQYTPFGQLQYSAPGDAFGAIVDISAGGTFVVPSASGVETCTVTVSTATLPISVTIIQVTITGLPGPNFATVLNATFDIVSGDLMQEGRGRAQLTATGADASLALDTWIYSISKHWGEAFVGSFWVSQQSGAPLTFVVEKQVDGGAWVPGTPEAVPSDTNYHRVDYTSSIGMFDSISCRLRIRCTNSTAGSIFYLEKAALHSPETGALYLGSNTIPRSRRREFFGQLIQLYMVEALETQAYNILGIRPHLGWGIDPWGLEGWGSPSYGNLRTLLTGLINYIVPTQVQLSVFQNTLSSSQNVVAVMFEDDFRAGTITNFKVVPRSPDRFSHLVPASPTTLDVVVAFDGTGAAILAEAAIMDPTVCVLTRNGEPMPNTTWSFTDATTIQLASLGELVPRAVYRFRYNVLVQFESDTLDLGPNYTLFNWKADWYSYRRCGLDVVESLYTQSIAFNTATLQATLQFRSNVTSVQNVLYVNNGSQIQAVSPNLWQFIDPGTVKVEPSAFNPLYTYSMTYLSRGLIKDQVPDETVEVQWSTDGVTWSAWTAVPHDAPFGNSYRYFKFRATVSNIGDVRDYKLRSLTMKGDPLDKVAILALP